MMDSGGRWTDIVEHFHGPSQPAMFLTAAADRGAIEFWNTKDVADQWVASLENATCRASRQNHFWTGGVPRVGVKHGVIQ